MFKHLGTFAVLAVCLLVMAMGGCGGDDDPPEEDPIKFVSADPADGSTIQNDATITVTFDGTPEGLQVTGGTATPGGKTVSIAGPFAAGPLVLGLQWEGEAVTLSYTVEEPIPRGWCLSLPGHLRWAVRTRRHAMRHAMTNSRCILSTWMRSIWTYTR